MQMLDGIGAGLQAGDAADRHDGSDDAALPAVREQEDAQGTDAGLHPGHDEFSARGGRIPRRPFWDDVSDMLTAVLHSAGGSTRG